MNNRTYESDKSNRNTSAALSSDEVQAMLGYPRFELQGQKPAIALSKILHTSVDNLHRMEALDGSDLQNIAVYLLRNLNAWSDGIELARTPNGGQMQMRNVRIGELDSGKTDKGGRKKDRNGTDIPCLRDFDLGVTCAMIPGPQGRIWSYFRICAASEVPSRDGRKAPYKPPVSSRPISAMPIQTQAAERLPQEGLFGALRQDPQERKGWTDPEMGGR